jgi:two-component system, OmpR family, response regulator
MTALTSTVVTETIALAAPTLTSRSGEGGSMRILVVDDEPSVAEAVRRGLVADGFAVDIAHDGADGLWLAEENPYAAIVLDLLLPGLNGFQVCERLRSAGNWTPILMLTAKDGELDEAEALETGADDYLTKPFSYVVLLARIRALLRRADRNNPDSVLAAGDLRLDTRRRQCWRGDTAVALSPRAFAVLEYLLRRAGDVVTKDEVVAAVWDHAFDGDPNIVEVYVSRLRSAIDATFGRHAIETVRGIGYRLACDGG